MNTMYKLPAYVAIMLIENDQIFLLKRHNTDWGCNLWSIPGGLLEEHETLMDATVREAHEEMGVVIDPTSLELVHVIDVQKSPTNTKIILGFYFLAKKWSGTPTNNEPHRHSDGAWFPLNALPENITDHALLAIGGMQSGQMYSESR